MATWPRFKPHLACNLRVQCDQVQDEEDCEHCTCRQVRMLLFVGCLTSQQHASVSQGRFCSDNCTCCHTEIEVADQTFHLTQTQYTDTRPTSPSADPTTPGAWQGSHFLSHWYDSTLKKIPAQEGFEPRTFCSRGARLHH